MPLTPEQQAELAAMRAKDPAPSSGGLTPEQRAELQAMRAGDSSTGAGQAFLEHAAEPLTLGYLPQVQARVERGADKLSQLLGLGRNSADSALQSQGFTIKNPDQSFVEMRDANKARQAQQSQDHPVAAGLGTGAGMLASMALPGGAAKSAAGRIGSAVAQGAAYNPGEEPGEESGLQLVDRGKSALMSGGLAGGGELLAAGGNKLADFLMQKAVGSKKYVPGNGNTLADAGVWGTKGRMTTQVDAGKTAVAQRIGGAVNQISGDIDSAPIAQSIYKEAEKFAPASGGPVASIDIPKQNAILQHAADVEAVGKISPTAAWERGKIAGDRGFSHDNPVDTLLGRTSQIEQQGYSQALKDAFAAQHPGVPNQVADEMGKYGALASASRSLQKDPTLTDALKSYGLKMALGGGIGAGLGHSSGSSAEGALAGLALGSPLGLSSGGQLASKSSKLLPYLEQLAVKAELERQRK